MRGGREGVVEMPRRNPVSSIRSNWSGPGDRPAVRRRRGAWHVVYSGPLYIGGLELSATPSRRDVWRRPSWCWGGLGMTASILPLPGKEPREGAGDTWPDGKTGWNATGIQDEVLRASCHLIAIGIGVQNGVLCCGCPPLLQPRVHQEPSQGQSVRVRVGVVHLLVSLLLLQNTSQVGVDLCLDLLHDLAPVVAGLLHVLWSVAL